MKKLASLAVVALLAAVALVAWSPTAQAYPDLTINLVAQPTTLYGGQTFTATATANTTCAWTLEWNGETRQKTVASSGAEASFVTTYTAPTVTKVTEIPLHGSCAYTPRSARSSAATATWQNTIVITVLPPSTAVSPPVGSDLPNLGGPNIVILIGGLVLLLSGAIAVTVARRRAEEAEIAASRA